MKTPVSQKRQRPQRSRAWIRANMSAVRSKNTKAELFLRSWLHGSGLRYRVHAKSLPGTPDIVFPNKRVAIFVDGDFWHGRLEREEGFEKLKQSLNANNARFWIEKIKSNIRRDDRVNRELEACGYRVLRFWERDVLKGCDQVVTAIVRCLCEAVD
jgi:DNA mismatch endonuclease, patch repair protein